MKKHIGYLGIRKDGRPICYRQPFAKELTPGRTRPLIDYSKTFDWGTLNEGTFQLALAILVDFTVDEQFAIRYHKEFAKNVLAEQNPDGRWSMSPSELQQTVEELQTLRTSATPSSSRSFG